MPLHRLLVAVVSSTLFVGFMLLADGPDPIRQLGVGLATGLFLLWLVRFLRVDGVTVATAMVIATTGELVLSLGWGLYGYRFAAIPWFVPPGHGVFYALAVASSRQPLLQRHRRAIAAFALVAGSAIAIDSLHRFGDSWGLLWWLGAAALIALHPASLLFSAAFVYTMLLEWAGTAIGNWAWYADVPFVHLTSGNPPSGVGILYCLLDLFTVMACASRPMARLLAWAEARERADESDASSLAIPAPEPIEG